MEAEGIPRDSKNPRDNKNPRDSKNPMDVSTHTLSFFVIKKIIVSMFYLCFRVRYGILYQLPVGLEPEH